MLNGASTIRAHGSQLRLLRRRSYSSADAFAAACESVSVPTIYRAERGCRVRKPYLERMARVLGVDVAEISALEPPSPAYETPEVLTGDWFGLYLCTDMQGRPKILTERARLKQTGTSVSGTSSHHGCNRDCCDVFTECNVIANVFTGRMVSVDWPYPFDAPTFVLSGVRDMSFLTGYLTWYDMDAQRSEASRYFLVREDRETFRDDVDAARRSLNDEMKIYAIRRTLDAGVDFRTAVQLVLEDRIVE
jgi:hypothetical protein